MANKSSSGSRCVVISAADDGSRQRSFVDSLRADALPKRYGKLGARSMLRTSFARAEGWIARERLLNPKLARPA